MTENVLVIGDFYGSTFFNMVQHASTDFKAPPPDGSQCSNPESHPRHTGGIPVDCDIGLVQAPNYSHQPAGVKFIHCSCDLNPKPIGLESLVVEFVFLKGFSDLPHIVQLDIGIVGVKMKTHQTEKELKQ